MRPLILTRLYLSIFYLVMDDKRLHKNFNSLSITQPGLSQRLIELSYGFFYNKLIILNILNISRKKYKGLVLLIHLWS